MAKTELEKLKELLDIQGYKGNWDYSEYMWGMYNGLELAVATMEDREPVYKEKPKHFGYEPKERDTWMNRLHKAWSKR